MRVRHLREADYRRMRWKNGGGWTTELAISPPGCAGADFDWRISIAEIESDGAFSTFPDCDRFIALLDGNGMRLNFDAAPSALLDQPLRFVPFSGDWKTQGSLLDGSVRDFNLIARRDRIRADVLHRPLVGTMVFPSDAHTTWFVYLASGRASVQHSGDTHVVASGESLLLQPDDTARNCVIDGGGDLLLVKLTSSGTMAGDN